MEAAHGILFDVTDHAHEVEFPARLPGQQQLPSEDGVPMETDRHREQFTHLVASLREATRGRDVYVAGDMFVYFSPRQLKNEHFRGPDVFVVVGAENKERLSWVYWEELRLPDVVIELTSPSTRELDYGAKKDVYEREWKTAVYAVYDPMTHQLDAWHLVGGRYVPAPRDERGDVRVEVLDLALGVRDLALDAALAGPSLRWIARDGQPLRTYAETTERIAALEAEIARLRGG